MNQNRVHHSHTWKIYNETPYITTIYQQKPLKFYIKTRRKRTLTNPLGCIREGRKQEGRKREN
jgi:hypothetical protein